jgi:hypothetical protein
LSFDRFSVNTNRHHTDLKDSYPRGRNSCNLAAEVLLIVTTPTAKTRKESFKSTWKLRFLLFGILLFSGILVVSLTRRVWTVKIGQSLVCKEQSPHSDALLLENFDPNYLVFERAAALQKAGIAGRILVPTKAADSETPNTVSEGIVEVMARVARLQEVEIIPIREIEPISLNAAKQIRHFLTVQHLKSVIVVSPGFRSRRSSLVYNAVLTPAGVTVGCVPVFGTDSPENWTKTWHGIQDVALQFLKLQYYRFHVLRNPAFLSPLSP